MTKEKFLSQIKDLYLYEQYSIIELAVEKAEKAHEGQLRDSGEPYVIHPINVASILADLGMDYETIVAALLHDTLEDTQYSAENIKKDFNEDVYTLVEGVTKLNRINFKTREDEQAENLRKMLLAMSHDIRVIIIKLADRLHNMRTINIKKKESIEVNSRETLDIYAPIAGRLGMGTLKCELEDIAMKYLYPDDYYKIVQAIRQKKGERDEFVQACSKVLYDKLHELGLEGEVNGRPKHIYSIYKKMSRGKTFEQIYDLIAMRVIVPTVKDCYEMLGAIHTIWRPLPGRFKDYIAMPKPNFYQSLHTTVFSKNGTPFEIQIRTYQMHKVAEYGIAAHWKYKENKRTLDEKEDKSNKLAWIREVIEIQKDMRSSKDFLNSLKIDLYPDDVFVFTPKGDVIPLPYGATGLDFAYKVHSEIGNKCVGVKINSKLAPLDTQLDNGDIIEVLISKSSKGPSRDWLNLVKTQSAKHKIRQFFKKNQKEDTVRIGKELIDRELKKIEGSIQQALLSKKYLEVLYKEHGAGDFDDICSMVGFADIKASHVVSLLLNLYNKDHKVDNEKQIKIKNKISKASNNLTMAGFDSMLLRSAKCCCPVPGDKVIGYITKGRGLCVHRLDCKNVVNFENERIVELDWPETKKSMKFKAKFTILSSNMNTITSISDVLSKFDTVISNMQMTTQNDSKVLIVVTVDVQNHEMLDEMMKRVATIKDVLEVYRD